MNANAISRPPPFEVGSEKGFTLIELSIVLVIIGLIVGGVVTGQELIHGAKIRDIIKEQSQLRAAIYAFKGKYNCVPGDCSTASTYFTGAFNGSGDGLICDSDDMLINCNESQEAIAAAQHLSMAGMITWPLSTPMDETVQAYGLNVLTPGRNIFGSPSWPMMGWQMQSLGPLIGDTVGYLYCSQVLNTQANVIFFHRTRVGAQHEPPD